MRCFVMINGGTGKSIMATAMMPLLAKKYDEVYVCSPYVDVFKACSYVTEAIPVGQPNTYRDLLLDDDVELLCTEPYQNGKFIKKQCHLFEAWAAEWGIELEQDPMDMHPVLDKWDEFGAAIKQYEEAKKGWGDKFILVQFTGGQSPLVDPNQMGQYNEQVEGIKRNYHKAQELINAIHEKYPDYVIVHYGLPNEPSYQYAVKAQLPYLIYRKACEDASAIVTIDSSLQHLAAGVNKAIVIWGETAPEHFGYNSHCNLRDKGIKNTQPYFQPLGASPLRVPFPTVDDVMNELDKMISAV